jgi:hypothetical protein
MNYVIPRPWKTATEEATNQEIDDTYMKPTRKRMKLQFSLKRKMFGREYNFQDKDNDANAVINAIEKTKIEYVRRRTNEIGLQAAKPLIDTASQTTWRKKVNMGIQTQIEKNEQPLTEDNT